MLQGIGKSIKLQAMASDGFATNLVSKYIANLSVRDDATANRNYRH